MSRALLMFILEAEVDIGLLQHRRWSAITKRSIVDVAAVLDPLLRRWGNS